jgi:hypothetical protein
LPIVVLHLAVHTAELGDWHHVDTQAYSTTAAVACGTSVELKRKERPHDFLKLDSRINSQIPQLTAMAHRIVHLHP